MGRKGGGKRGFMKAARRAEDSEVDQDLDDALGGPPSQGDTAAVQSAGTPRNGDTPAAQAIDNDEAVRPSSPVAHNDDASASSADDERTRQETRGQMLQRHKREHKELKDQAKRAGKKAKDEFKEREASMAARHEQELSALVASAPQAANPPVAAVQIQQRDPNKKSKALRRREKQEALDREKEAAMAAEFAAMGETDRMREEKALGSVLLPYGLRIVDIPADGNCMYRSLAHQCEQKGLQRLVDNEPTSVAHQVLRRTAARYIRAHAADFLPFIVDDADEASPSQQLERYCDLVEGIEWGTQVELQALAAALQVHIQVFSAALNRIDLGEEFAGRCEPTLQVCYQQHAFGTGEHYNSVAPIESGLPESDR